jgi:hypothetical protein
VNKCTQQIRADQAILQSNFAVHVGKRVSVCHLLSQDLNLSAIPTGPFKCCLDNLKVFSCSKLVFFFISKSKCNIMIHEKQGKSWLKLDPSCFNLDLFFVCTFKYVCIYRTSLRYYITPTGFKRLYNSMS